jgi:aryl-alcohol dehydrogenase (NADP+)
MEHTFLGRSGVRVPRIALGTATFGLQCDEAASRAILDHAVELGSTWFDTSTSYPLGSGPSVVGVTEALLGRWLRGRRDSCFLSTKVYNRTGPASWQLGLSRHHLMSAVDGSLTRLGTDHIDLLQLHRWDAHTPVEETLEALRTLVESGKVRYVGCCNFTAYQIAQVLTLSEVRRLPLLQTAQLRYNLLTRGPEIEAFQLCREKDVTVLAFNVLAGGLLAGKYERGNEPGPESRFSVGEAGERYRARYWNDTTFDVVDRVRLIAKEAGVSMPTLATAWVLNRPEVVAVIGASKASHVDTAFEALRLKLDEDVVAALDEATADRRRPTEEIQFESS